MREGERGRDGYEDFFLAFLRGGGLRLEMGETDR